MGHWEIHAEISQTHLCTQGDLGFSYKNSPPEIEANIFAAELLMPEFIFKLYCDASLPDLAHLSMLASTFQVTLTAAAVRFAELTEEHFVVVFSKNRKINWLRSSKKSGLWIEPGLTVPKNTFASDAFDGKPIPGTMESIPAINWFPNNPLLIDRPILECSTPLNRYGSVLSLLWLPAENPS